MAAKVDSSLIQNIQNPFQLYQHNFIFSKSGKWAVIQQGMAPEIQKARRYHWLSSGVKDFVEEPHSGIVSDVRAKPLNLTAKESSKNREISTELVTEEPKTFLRDMKLVFKNQILVLKMFPREDCRGVLTPFLFSLLILLLHTQLGRNFWSSYAFVFGLKIDYLSPTVYFTDLLVVGILFFWGFSKFKKNHINLKGYIRSPYLLSFIFYLLINIFLAKIPILAFWKWLKVLEVAALAYFVFKESVFVRKALNRFLRLMIIYESLIVAGQFLKQSSLGGIFWWLGERTFSLSTPGIAKGEFFGRLFLRPYGTFSHPNSLAGFTLVALILILPSLIKKNNFLSVFCFLSSVSYLLSPVFCLLTPISHILCKFVQNCHLLCNFVINYPLLGASTLPNNLFTLLL